MKIKSINPISFEISLDTITVVTDPLASTEFGLKFPKSSGDVAVFTQKKYEGVENVLSGFDKLVPQRRESIFEITTSGEFEIGQMMIQRPINTSLYMFDQGYSRAVYVGLDSKEMKKEIFKDLGDVEVLILPVGDGGIFPDYDMLQYMISEIAPSVLVPYAYSDEGFSKELGLKSKEEFLKHFGYSNFKDEKSLKVASRLEGDESAMEIVFLV